MTYTVHQIKMVTENENRRKKKSFRIIQSMATEIYYDIFNELAFAHSQNDNSKHHSDVTFNSDVSTLQCINIYGETERNFLKKIH